MTIEQPKSKFYDWFNLDLSEIERIKNRNRLLSALPQNFGQTIQFLCEESGLDEEIIADLAFLSDRMIRKWKADENNTLQPKLENIVKFCHGLFLPGEVCEFIWLTLGHIYRNNEMEQSYKEISTYYHLDLKEINSVLRDYGLKTWQERNR